MIHHYISEELAYALGWTLLHSLWQGLAIGLILFTALHFTKQKAAVARYWMSNLALLSLLTSTLFTFHYFYSSNSDTIQEISFQASSALQIVQIPVEESPVNLYTQVQHWLAFFDQHIVLLSSCWFIGLLFFALRLLLSFAQVQNLRSTAQALSNTNWTTRLNTLVRRLGLGKTISLFESAHIQMPMTLGYLKPIILLPIGTINQLAPEQVEAILAHELAHIARHDYLFNLLQSIIEVLFFYHPVVWWMSANIRAERENCCDDLAIRLCNNSLTYAKALVRVQELQYTPLPRLALTLFGNKKQLLTRIQRILNHPQSKSSSMEKLTATALLVVVFCFYSATNIWQAEAIEPPIETATTESFAFSDTIPNMRGTSKISIKNEEQDVDVKLKDGLIQSLKIDGENIPASEFEAHEAMVEELIKDIPPPPSAPPVPPNPLGVTPPAPPTPPTPPSFEKKNIRIEKRVEEDGNTYLHIKKGSCEDSKVIRIEEEDEINIDGNALFLDTDEEGENEVIILKDGVVRLNGEALAAIEGFNFDFDFDEVGESFNSFDFEDLGNSFEDLELHFEGFENSFDNFDFHFNFDSIPPMTESQVEEIRERMDLKREEIKAMREEMKVQREEMHEIRERAHAEAKKSREEAHERMKEAHKEMEKAHKKQHEVMQRIHKEQHEIHKQHQKIHRAAREKSDALQNTIKENLLRDGLIKNGKKYKFHLTNTTLKVDGKTQSKAMFKKYTSLIESLTDNKIDEGGEVKIKVNGNSTSTSMNFNNNHTISID